MIYFLWLWWGCFWVVLFGQGNEPDIMAAATRSGAAALALVFAVLLFRFGTSLLKAAWYNDERLREYEDAKKYGRIIDARGNQSGELK